jgi:hypothetical protein
MSMIIYYDSSTKKIGVVERNSEIYINGFKSDEVLFEILKSIGCGDLMFNPNNNVIYVKDQFDLDLKTIKKIFFVLNHNDDKDLPTYIFLDNKGEPRSYQSSNFLNYVISKTNIPKDNITILTGTRTTSVNKNGYRIIFYPYDFLNFFKITTDSFQLPENVVKTKLLSSFNRRMNSQRIVQTAKICDKFDMKELNISLGIGHDNQSQKDRDRFHCLIKKDLRLPIVSDLEFLETDDDRQFNVQINKDTGSLLSVVNETIATGTDPNGVNSENQDVYYCSEKSIRPFLNLQIPIFNSTIGYSEWFEKTYGFDLFTDIIDYRKWDKIFNIYERSDIISEEIMNFKNKYPNYNEFFQDNKERFIKNFKKVPSLDKSEFFREVPKIKRNKKLI